MYHEAGLIDTKDGMQFKIYSNSHPKDFIIAKPKYIPTDLIELAGFKKRFILSKCMNRFNLFTKKEVIKENLNKLKSAGFSDLIFHSETHNNWFLGVTKNKIKTVYDTREGLRQLLKVPDEDLDNYLSSAKEFITALTNSGVSLDNFGISHSTLLCNYTPGKSDIDIIIFGKENGWKVIRFLESFKHLSLKWKSKEEWGEYYDKRVVSKLFSKEEYVFNMMRKKDDGFYNGHVFSLFVVENENEFWYNWSDRHEPLETVKLSATVKDDYNSIVRPGFYELENSKIISGYKEVSVRRIVNWSRPFTLQVKKGEKLEATGLLEKIQAKEGEFYQLVIGYFDSYINERGEQEYIKALVKNALL